MFSNPWKQRYFARERCERVCSFGIKSCDISLTSPELFRPNARGLVGGPEAGACRITDYSLNKSESGLGHKGCGGDAF